MYKDKSGMFKDFNFKLVVLNSLLEKETSFSEKMEDIKLKVFYHDEKEIGLEKRAVQKMVKGREKFFY